MSLSLLVGTTISIITAENHVTSKQQQSQIPLKKNVDSGETFFDISVYTGQIYMGVETDTPENNSNMPFACDSRTKIRLKRY